MNSHTYEMFETIAGRLDEYANLLDGWARESRTGGWATHQVNENIENANKMRRDAAEIRSFLKRKQYELAQAAVYLKKTLEDL